MHAHLYNKEFKYQLKHEEKFAIIKTAPKKDAFFDAFVGIFPDDQKLAYIETRYKEAFQPVELPRCADTFLSLMRERHCTP